MSFSLKAGVLLLRENSVNSDTMVNIGTEEDSSCIFLLRNKLAMSIDRISLLEMENEQLKLEVQHLRRNVVLPACPIDRTLVMSKKMQASASSNTDLEEKKIVRTNFEDIEESPNGNAMMESEFSSSKEETKVRSSSVQKPPPKPSCFPLVIEGNEETWLPPPPPPPPPSKLPGQSIKAIQRVPEVAEFYRFQTRKGEKIDTEVGNLPFPNVVNAREMIGEIENRSAYVLAIKSDVESQGEFINSLMKEVENANFRDISEVDDFIKWLDEKLSYLVDERAVLKHFPRWPEPKTDAMREAAFSYRNMKNLEYEVSTFHDDKRHTTSIALKQIQTLQDKLERSVHDIEMVRDSTIKRYRNFRIPWEWMLDTGIIAQLKLESLKLAKKYMNRIMTTIRSGALTDNEELILRGARFAFRIHQFVGGFNEGCKNAFQEFKELAGSRSQI